MTNEEKILQILKLMQSDIKNVQQGQDRLEQGQNGLDRRMTGLAQGQQEMRADINRLEQGQIKIGTRMETEVIDKINALFDARNVQNDINERIINSLNRIEAKVDVLQMETAYIRRVK